MRFMWGLRTRGHQWKMSVYLFCFVCCWGFWSVRWLRVHMCGLPLPEARRVHPHCCWCKPPTERERLSDVENADIKASRLFHSPYHFTSSSTMKPMTVLIPVDNSIKFEWLTFIWHSPMSDVLLILHECIKKKKLCKKSLAHYFSSEWLIN